MAVCLVLAHPDRSSLSSQIFREAKILLERRGETVYAHDLYYENFDPVMPLNELKRRMSLDPQVSRYSRELMESSCIIIIHPDWWGGAPSILKGWVDRVFRPGTAYDEIQDFPGEKKDFIPLLTGKKISIVVLSHRDVSSLPLRIFWNDTVFAWCGVDELSLYHLKNIPELEAGQITDWKRDTLQSLIDSSDRATQEKSK